MTTRYPLIYTKDYILAVDETKQKQAFPDKSFVILHQPLNGAKVLEGVPLLPKMEDEPIGKPMLDYVHEKHSQDRCMGFIDGYNKRSETHKYTEANIKKAIAYGMSRMINEKGIPTTKELKEFIDSLNQLKKPIAVEVEILFLDPEYLDSSGKYFSSVASKEKLIPYTFPLITTTTNQEGQQVAVGTYIYE